ncbi:MAG: ABC transporter ATP-binding protein [Patescibacteria group bacterium]|nr:ABC transporter ATP-binding protein [Patescibacteria group bacterium]MDE2438453.1 ABC transporter ATP-binding protein [Patescibacteria group bacterium]
MDNVIEVKGISKQYTINHERLPYHSLRDDLIGLLKKPIRWLHGHQEVQEPFWALKGITFEVKKGEVLGIIGANGAGKSTLLKILSRITYPTTGEIVMQGRVGSLLEVGTGFHPELTGRENIYLNGVILGMTKKEIDAKFDEIVTFAGIERFLDTPVKHYSSGMYVRLAFSVAAHLEPDILIVDEVLAVGDAEFQKKSLGKMEEITKKGGRTILFVSHNMDAVQAICKKSILLEHGSIKMMGDTKDVIHTYLYDKTRREPIKTFEGAGDKKQACLNRITILNDEKNPSTDLSIAKPFYIEVEYTLKSAFSAFVVLKLFSTSLPNQYLFVSWSNDNGYANPSEPGTYRARIKVDPILNTGMYSYLVGIATHTEDYIDYTVQNDIISIQNVEGFPFPVVMHGRQDSFFLYSGHWNITPVTPDL